MKRLEHRPLRARRERQGDDETKITSALMTVPSQTNKGDDRAPVLSEGGFLRHIGRLWIRRAMLFCAVCAVGCALAVPLLSRLRVEQVIVIGASRYEEQEIASLSGIAVGEELLLHKPDDIEESLLSKLPYLSTVTVERSLTGKVHITLTERTPAWALWVDDCSLALVDEQMRVLELVDAAAAAPLCQVRLELFSSGQTPSAITPGQTYGGNAAAIAKLSQISAAILSVPLCGAPTVVDMTDLYDIRMSLEDGSLIALHECRSPEQQFRAAMDALSAYRAAYGQNGQPLLVDVDDFSRVTLRPLT